jgi:hypothetical protein
MSDQSEHKTPLEIIGDQVCDLLPEPLRNDKEFAYDLGRLCGFVAGWFVGKKVIELLFPTGDDK